MLVTNRTTASMQASLRSAITKASEVWLASAYVSPGGCEMLGISDIAKNVPVKLTVGRALEEGMPQPTLGYLRWLDGTCRGAGGGVQVASPPCHSKLYCFRMSDDRLVGWLGSSNLTEHGLADWVEANACPSDPGLLKAVLAEAQAIWQSGVQLDDPAVRAVAPRHAAAPVLPAEPGVEGAPGLTLSLFASRKREVQEKAGLNWWRGAGRQRSPNEAYVALPRAVLEQATKVFGGNTIGTVFRAITHDGTKMDMCLEASGTPERREAKQISSLGNKSTFGEWILRRMLQIPEWQQVTRKDLEAYGRTDITFYRIGNDPTTGKPVIFVDFSP